MADWRATDGTGPVAVTTTPLALETAGSAPPGSLDPDGTVTVFAVAIDAGVRSPPAAASRWRRGLSAPGSVAVAGLALLATADAAAGWVDAPGLFAPASEAGPAPGVEAPD
jgi:hypothetical protein